MSILVEIDYHKNNKVLETVCLFLPTLKATEVFTLLKLLILSMHMWEWKGYLL